MITSFKRNQSFWVKKLSFLNPNFLLRFHPKYFAIFLLLFAVEVCIALFLHDRFVRPYVGDFLVVILLYCFARSFLNIPVLPLAIAVLLFAYAIETAQYFHIVNRLGFEHNPVMRTIIGNSFEWGDIIAYTLGIALVILLERRPQSKPKPLISSSPISNRRQLRQRGEKFRDRSRRC